MNRLLQMLTSLVLAVILVAAAGLVYSTVKGNAKWYFRVNGQVTVDGRETSGYMHADTDRTVLVLTRTDGVRPETYVISLGEQGAIHDCGEWHPIRFLPFFVNRANAPCAYFTPDPAKVLDAPVAKTLFRGRRSVEFSTASGRKVRAEL